MEEVIQVLRGMGFSESVAEALAEREVTPEEAATMDTYDVLDHVLAWEGIIGFTGKILRTVRSVDEIVAARK